MNQHQYNKLTLTLIRRYSAIFLNSLTPKKLEVLPDCFNSEVNKLFNSMAILGYTLDDDSSNVVINEFYKRPAIYTIYCQGILYALTKLNKNKKYAPLYTDFPESVNNLSPEKYYSNAIIHYITGAKGFDKKDKRYTEDLKGQESKLLELTQLKLASWDFIKLAYTNLVSSKVPLSDSDKEDLLVIADVLSDEDLIDSMPNVIPIKETMVELISLFKKRGLPENFIKTPTDILRYLSALAEQEDSPRSYELAGLTTELNSKMMYIPNLSSKQQRKVCQWLNKMTTTRNMDNMMQYRNIWKRYFRLYTFPRGRYKNVASMTDKLFSYNKVSYTTHKGILDKHLKYLGNTSYTKTHDLKYKSRYDEIIDFNKEASKDIGEYVRNILSYLSQISNKDIYQHTDSASQLSKLFSKALIDNADNINSRILYSLILRINFLRKNKKIQAGMEDKFRNDTYVPRLVRVSGKINILKENDLELNLSDEILMTLLEAITEALILKCSKKEGLGKVWIDPRYSNIKLSTSQKDTSKTNKPLTQGSWINLPKADTYRFFTTWRNIPDSQSTKFDVDWDNSRVDIDLSSIMFDKDFDNKGVTAYYNNDFDFATRSGDVTDAPNGATEYIDYDMSKFESYLKNGGSTRYVLMNVNSYTGQSFNTIGSVQAGVMVLTKEEANNKLFMSSAVANGFSVTGNNINNNALLFDLVDHKYMWIDESLNINAVHNVNASILSNFGLGSLVNQRYIQSELMPTLYDVYYLNILARGNIVQGEMPVDDDTVTCIKYPENGQTIDFDDVNNNWI